MWPVVLSNSSVISAHRISAISDNILLQQQVQSWANGDSNAWQTPILLKWGSLPSNYSQIRSYANAPTDAYWSIEVWKMLYLDFDVLWALKTTE